MAQFKKRNVSRMKLAFDRFSTASTRVSGRPMSFVMAVLIVLVWAISGPFFHYNENWQLVINTGTTIITFLMVFIIQQSQNKDTVALHLKLNELIAASKNASNRLIDIEDLTEDELIALKEFYVKLSELAEEDDELFTSHSVDEARQLHNDKQQRIDKKIGSILPEAPANLHAHNQHFDERNSELSDSI